jgi:hypothetical protein
MVSGWLIAVIGGGAILLMLLIFVFLVPWGEGPVAPVELPRARLLEAMDGDPEWPYLSISVDESGAIALPGEGRGLLPDIERAVREHREDTEGKGAVVLLLHRHGRWSVLRAVLEAGARAGQSRYHVRMACGTGFNHLLLVLDGSAESVVTLTSTETAGREEPAAVRVELDGNLTVEPVLNALEGYAAGRAVTLTGLSSR